MESTLEAHLQEQIEVARKVILRDRKDRLGRVKSVVLDYVKRKNLILSDVAVLLSEEINDIEWPIKIYSDRSYQDAKNIAKNIFDETKTKFTRMKTVEHMSEFSIDYDTELIVSVHQIKIPRNVNVDHLAQPRIIKGFKFLSPEIEFIDWLRKAGNPENAEEWSENSTFTETGRRLYSMAERDFFKSGGTVIGGSAAKLIYKLPDIDDLGHLSGKSTTSGGSTMNAQGGSAGGQRRKQENTIMECIAALRKINNLCIVGELAKQILSGQSKDFIVPQIVIEGSIDEVKNTILRYLRGANFIQRTSTVPKQSNFATWIVQWGDMISLEIFSFAQQELVSCIRHKDYLLGSDVTNLRVLFITMWKLRTLLKTGKISQSSFNTRMRQIWTVTKWFVEFTSPSIVFIGKYLPQPVMNKVARHGMQMHRPYYPAV